jgi:hypothetical protein
MESEVAKQVHDAVVTETAARVSYGGGVATITGWAIDNNTVLWIGAATALLSFAVQMVFAFRRDRREALAHTAYMDRLRKTTKPADLTPPP